MMNLKPLAAYNSVMNNKPDLIKKQRDYIRRALFQYNITLTEIAKNTGIASTTLTRWYNSSPKHALSATTFDKISNKYALDDGADKNQLGETDLAMSYAIKTLIGIMLKYKLATPKEFEEPFSQAVELYQAHRLPEAVKVMEDFRTFAKGGIHPQGSEMLRKLLELAPVGLA